MYPAGPAKDCPGEGCTAKIAYSLPLCLACQQQRAAQELAISMHAKHEVWRLEQLLRFEAWLIDHPRPKEDT